MSRHRLRLYILLISDIARRPAPDPAPTLIFRLSTEPRAGGTQMCGARQLRGRPGSHETCRPGARPSDNTLSHSRRID